MRDWGGCGPLQSGVVGGAATLRVEVGGGGSDQEAWEGSVGSG